MTKARADIELPPGTEPELVSRKEAARICGLSPETFEREVEAGTFPGPFPLRRTRRKLWHRRALLLAMDRKVGIEAKTPVDDFEERERRWKEEQARKEQARREAPARLVIRFEGRRLLTLTDDQMRAAAPNVVASALKQLGFGGDGLERLAEFVLAQPAPDGGTIGEMNSAADVEVMMRGGKLALNVSNSYARRAPAG